VQDHRGTRRAAPAELRRSVGHNVAGALVGDPERTVAVEGEAPVGALSASPFEETTMAGAGDPDVRSWDGVYATTESDPYSTAQRSPARSKTMPFGPPSPEISTCGSMGEGEAGTR